MQCEFSVSSRNVTFNWRRSSIFTDILLLPILCFSVVRVYNLVNTLLPQSLSLSLSLPAVLLTHIQWCTVCVCVCGHTVAQSSSTDVMWTWRVTESEIQGIRQKKSGRKNKRKQKEGNMRKETQKEVHASNPQSSENHPIRNLPATWLCGTSQMSRPVQVDMARVVHVSGPYWKSVLLYSRTIGERRRKGRKEAKEEENKMERKVEQGRKNKTRGKKEKIWESKRKRKRKVKRVWEWKEGMEKEGR